MISYIALFYTSFLYHAIKTPEYFGRLIISALLLQVFGTLAYLVAPAVGPFIYEAGVNPMITGGQHSMLEFYRNSVATGPAFLAKHGSINFTVGLAAMPRSEEHTSELQSLMRISYAVFCLKKKHIQNYLQRMTILTSISSTKVY